MRVLLVPQYFYPTYGGIQHFTSRLGEALSNYGTDVSIFSPPAESDRDSFDDLHPHESIRWRTIGSTRKCFWKELPQHFSSHFDTIAFFSIEFEELIEAQLRCFQEANRHALLTFVRIAATGDFSGVIEGRPDRLRILQSVTGMIAPTAHLSQEVFRGSGGTISPVVIPNPVDPKYCLSKMGRGKLREKLALPSGFIAIWAGRFDDTKRLDDLVRAWAIAAIGGHLVLVGDDPYRDRTYRNYLLRIISEEDIDGVLLPGHQREVDMPCFYQASDLYVCTSSKEGHSNASLEAASCGLPVVAYDVPGVRETVLEFSSPFNRLVSNGSLSELADAIRDAHQSFSVNAGVLPPCEAMDAALHSMQHVARRYVEVLFGRTKALQARRRFDNADLGDEGDV